MKGILNFIKWFLVGVWFIVAVFTTVCLISYNDYKVSVIGKNSFVIMDNNDLQPTFKENDLVIVKKDSQKEYQVGDYIFFYNGIKSNNNAVNYGAITDIQAEDNAEYGYYIGTTKINYSDVIGKANGAMIYHHMGLILSIFESQWGFMFLVILPTLFALVYEIYSIAVEVRKNTKKIVAE